MASNNIISIPELVPRGTSTHDHVAPKIPCLGFGTATYPLGGSDTMKESILHAIELGYRHFDTAPMYQTEECLGEAIAEALSLGLIRSRHDLFITSKLWSCDAHKDRVLPAIKNTLKKLRLEYIDLYLIHWPVALKQPGNYDFPFDKNELVALDFRSVWEAMEECQKLGLTKSIGVSNLSCKKLENLLVGARIPPAVNQVEMNPVWQQKKLKEFCEEKGILIMAYSPLGAKGTPWGTDRVMECEVLKEIASAKGKSVAQICLRWAHEQGLSLIVKSFDKKRIKENLDIFDWKLSPDELHKISEIPQQKGYAALEFVHEAGPYKSAEEFWDGEI